MGPVIPTGSRSELETWCDRRARSRVRLFGQYCLNVDPKDQSLTPHLVKEGYWESWVTLAVARAVKPGWRCLDLGANVGYYTLLMAKLGCGRSMAVEPNPETAELLRRTLDDNELYQFEVVQKAVANVDLSGRLHRYGDLHGSDSLVKFDGFEVTGGWDVEVTTVDRLLHAWNRLDFVKVDVEGAESLAWEGMEDTLLRFPGAVVCVEVGNDRPYDLDELLGRMARHGDVGMVSYDGDVVPLDLGAVRGNEWSTAWVAP